MLGRLLAQYAVEVLLNWQLGSGGQCTTAGHLGRFLQAVFETDRVLDDAGRTLLVKPSAYEPYGFGIALVDTPAGRMLCHNGLLLGSATYMAYFPAKELSVTMNVNAMAIDGNGAMLADKLYGKVLQAINE